MCQQIHIGKGQFAGHVDPAQFLTELDAIKESDPLLQQEQVGQVQIAMAFAHVTGLLACRHQRCQQLLLLVGPALQYLDARLRARVWQQRMQIGEILPRLFFYAGR